MSLLGRPPGGKTPARPERAPERLTMALDYRRKGWHVFPVCPAIDGACGCGGGHQGRDIGKAPVGRFAPHGVKDATTNSATITRWWEAMPLAGIGIALEASGLVLVDPDSAETEAAAISRGLDGGVVRESRNRAYVFTRSEGCPAINVIKLDGDPLDIMATGYMVAHNTHATGVPVRLDPESVPGPAPSWAVDLLKAKAAERAAREATTAARRQDRAAHGGDEPPVRLRQRGMQRWTGELVAESAPGKIDRSESLYFLGLDLAEANASESTIIAALAERDESLGWRKFTGRSDADRRYGEIAEKAVARAMALEEESGRRPAGAPPAGAPEADAGVGPDHLDCPEANRLRGLLLDRDDRIELLEDIVHSIDDVLSCPNETMGASEKVAMIVVARWLPYYRSKREAKGQDPTISLGYLAKVAGMSKSTMSGVLKRFCSGDPNDGAPLKKRVTRRPKVDENGSPVFDPETGRQMFESDLEVAPWGARPAETLRASVTFASTRPKAKHGGSKEAAAARWGECGKHQNRDVRVRGYCPDCGSVVGERTVTRAEFDALNEQVAHSDAQIPPHVSRNPIGEQVAHSDGVVPIYAAVDAGSAEVCGTHGRYLDHKERKQGACSWCTDGVPTLTLVVPGQRPTGVWRCPASGCRSLERRIRTDGSWRCASRGHESSDYEALAAIAGGES